MMEGSQRLPSKARHQDNQMRAHKKIETTTTSVMALQTIIDRLGLRIWSAIRSAAKSSSTGAWC